jgi:hypothetical protein
MRGVREARVNVGGDHQSISTTSPSAAVIHTASSCYSYRQLAVIHIVS